MDKKIVVVDDEAKISSLLKALLEPHGYQVLIAHDGLIGYELIQQELPDLAIVDILLPRLDGFDLCKKLKDNSKLSHIPVILTTGIFKEPRYRLEGKRAGAEEFLEKPFEFEYLLSKVKNFVPLAEECDLDPSVVHEQLTVLRKAYLGLLPGKIDNIKTTWQNLCNSQWSQESFETIHLMIHSLHGSGATYGFTALTNTASALEFFLESIIENHLEPTEQEKSVITQHIEDLERIADETDPAKSRQ